MPTTVNSDLIIYDDLAQTAFLERRQDNLAIFNASSNGAILLDNELIEGDFRKRAFYKVGGSIESRDVNSTEKVTGKKIGAGEAVSVKAPWKYGPYETTEEAFKRRGRSVDEFSEVIGTDVADATLEGYVKYGLKALTAAIGANADMVVTADIETDGKKTLTRGLRKYGDKFNRVVLFVMHSATYFDIVDEAIANKIYEEAGVVVYGGQPGTLGKPVLVTDTMDADAILGLVAGAVTVTESQAPGFRSYDINDQENLAVGYRAEGVVNVDLLGYSWDTGASVGTVQSLMTELVGMGSLTQQQLEKAAGSTALAVQTGIVSAQDITKAYKDIEKDPVKALQSLNEQYNFLTVSQLKHVDDLIKQKDQTAAVTQAMDLFGDTMAKRGEQAYDSLTPFGRLWLDIKGWASEAMQSIGQWVAELASNTLKEFNAIYYSVAIVFQKLNLCAQGRYHPAQA